MIGVDSGELKRKGEGSIGGAFMRAYRVGGASSCIIFVRC